MGIYWNQGIISPRGLSSRLQNSTLIPSWLNELGVSSAESLVSMELLQ
jgi:hypothetical protein